MVQSFRSRERVNRVFPLDSFRRASVKPMPLASVLPACSGVTGPHCVVYRRRGSDEGFRSRLMRQRCVSGA